MEVTPCILPTFERVLVVYSIVPTTEVTTRETIYQVLLGEFVDMTPDLLNVITQNQQALEQPVQIPANRIPVLWLAINFKGGEVPYLVGSRWKLTIKENGNMDLVSLRE